MVGTWTTEGIWMDVPSTLVYYANFTFKISIEMGTIDFSLNDGAWSIKDGILTMELADTIPLTNFTYQFSEDSRILTLTNVDSGDTYALRKQ